MQYIPESLGIYCIDIEIINIMHAINRNRGLGASPTWHAFPWPVEEPSQLGPLSPSQATRAVELGWKPKCGLKGSNIYEYREIQGVIVKIPRKDRENLVKI